MDRSYFRQIKEAFTETSLDALGIQQTKGRKKEWQSIVCPCCSDSDGSARISIETGYLICFQCSREMDIFEWWMEFQRLDSLIATCKDLASRMSVDLEPPKKKGKGRESQQMTPDRLERAIHNLFTAPEAEWARKHFKERGLWDEMVLARCGVGFLEGHIIFAQFYPNGELRERYRMYTPLAKQKWRWSKGGGPPNGFWPFYIDLPRDSEILMCEGEMDVLAALIKGRTHRRKVPITPYTWTGGAASPVGSRLMPDSWPGRTVWICYDNDTFQGPDVKTHRSPNPKKTKDMLRRRENLIGGVARVFEANKCKVWLVAVPIDPIDNFGADLRDWFDEGKSFDEMPSWTLKDLLDPEDDPLEIAIEELGESVGEFVKIKGSVHSIGEMNLLVPQAITIKCPAGEKQCCMNCGVQRKFPDGTVDCSLHRAAIMNAYMSRNPTAHMMKNLLGKPNTCNECVLEIDESTPGAHWTITAEESSGLDRTEVISTEQPSLAGEISLTGYVHHANKGVGILATHLEQLDRPHFDLNAFHNDLLPICPWGSTDEDLIWTHLNSMVADYENNITHIYGRPEIHLLASLVAHSVLWYRLDGHTFRGWLDACTFGKTRAGKSEAIKRLFEHWQVGQTFTCMENFSRAGLTVGGAQSGMQMQPGLFPKNHGKMLFLDEFHHMSSGPTDKNVMVHLQSARDEGKVSAVKVYGTTKLLAAVRLITAGNFAMRKRYAYQYLCQHLLAFYGVPEALGRLDFAWAVTGDVKMIPEETEHIWTPSLSRALILRAWAMEPHQIHLEKDARKLAEQKAKEWDAIYAAEELPLHTGAEKMHCLIRTAHAIANKCYSHPDDKPRECLTRRGHMVVAIDWLLRCFENLQYDIFSQRVIRGRTVSQPYVVEALLTISLELEDPDHAMVVLSQLAEAQDIRHLAAMLIGQGQIEEQRHFYKWVGSMQRLSALQKDSSLSTYNVTYTPTQGCSEILKKLINLATNEPEEYVQRYRILEPWAGSPEAKTRTAGISADPPGLTPLDEVVGEEFDDGIIF